MNLKNEINAIHPNLVQKLGFQFKKTNFGSQNIDRSYLNIFGIVIVEFFTKDKFKIICFFEKTFLLV